jgi:GNAT superfamily N-acetyltransferase
MPSTERALALGPAHLAGCLELSGAANWNQNEADWRLMLGLGRGWGLTLAQGTLAATTLVLPYGSFAWVSMVLVHPEHRRKGYATRLLRLALEHLEKEGQTPILDATTAGRAVYAQQGFRAAWGFGRFARARAALPPTAAASGVRELGPEDWPAILALDRQAFGASRERVLRALAARLPAVALVAERDGNLEGFALGRDGREAAQLGPVVAREPSAARRIIAAALSRLQGPVYLDLLEREIALRDWIELCGFALQRPFTRMVRGADHAPGDASLVVCPAGPELG